MYVRDDQLQTVADTTMAVPDGGGTFADFNSQFPISGDAVAFTASGTASATAIFSDVGGILHRVADGSTPIPEGSGTFTSFYPLVSLDDDTVAFIGGGDGGQEGLYLSRSGSISRVIDLQTPLDSKVLADIAFYDQGLSGDRLVFQAFFNDGSNGLYVAVVPEPGASLIIAPFLFRLCTLRSRRSRSHTN